MLNVLVPKYSITQAELRDLVASNWNVTSALTSDQYTSAQDRLWDETRLREYFLEQVVVASKGPKEHLAQLAKSKYSSYVYSLLFCLSCNASLIY